MRRAVVVVTLLLVLGHVAEAGPKRRQTARLLSGASAGVSAAVVASGFMFARDGHPFNKPVLYTGLGLLAVTPSAGELYSAQYLTWGMGIRAAGAGFALWVLQNEVDKVRCDSTNAVETCEELSENAAPLLGVAAIIFIGGTWYDILDAGDAADRYNARHGFTVTPTAVRGPQGLAPGLALSATF